MPRDAAYELTDAEKRDLIKLINEGKPLPEKHRFILFNDKREVELVWNGKTREVCTTILPFQTLEHIDEPRKEKGEDDELGLDTGGRQVKGWTNKLIWGDNKLILSSLKSGALRRQIEDAGGLKLIYIDPPFDVGADFSMDIEIGGETFHKEPNLLEQIAYRDTWGRGADSFIAIANRTNNLFIRAQACDGDCARNNLPLWWQLANFGVTAVDPDADYDGDNVTNLDDPTATVTAQITDASGTPAEAEGLVERNGLVWVEHLPLGPGTNTLTLTMTNAAGLSTSTNLTVVQSDVVLALDDLSTTDLNQPRILVSGSISSSDYKVWVNGVPATNTWANGNASLSFQVQG